MQNAAANLLLLVLLFVPFYLVAVRPQRKRFEAQRRMQASLGLGDEVTTSGGLVGTVRQLGDDELRVELAPDLIVRVKRHAVLGVVAADDEEDLEESDELEDLDELEESDELAKPDDSDESEAPDADAGRDEVAVHDAEERREQR